jgi:hypothetical protein
MATEISLTGFLDDEVIAEDAGTRARFRVCVSPSDDRVDELALPCVVADAELARAVLREFQPGDYIRVTGHLGLPRIAGHPLWLHVATLELLDTAPLRLTDTTEDTSATQPGPGDDDPSTPAAATLSDHGSLERFGPYLVYTDPDRCADSVWTHTGEWVGAAVYPTTATDVITAHQQRTAGGDV